jgi:hypothetical protein
MIKIKERGRTRAKRKKDGGREVGVREGMGKKDRGPIELCICKGHRQALQSII